MADIRDSVASALQKTLFHLATPAKGMGFAAAAPAVSQDAKDLLARAKEKVRDIKDTDLAGDDFIHTDDRDVAILLSALEHSTPPMAKAALPGVHKYDTTDPNWIAAAVEMLLSKRAEFISWKNLSDFRVPMPEDDLQ